MPARVGESVPKPYYTADMVREMPDDGNRYELVYGELLVSPAPRWWHQFAVGEMFAALREYLRAHPVGYPIMSPADISWGRDDVLVQPDVFVVPLEQARTHQWTAMRDLLLVAEVLSPSNQHYDRFLKRHRYQDAGVPLYWIIDAEEQFVEVWTPADRFPTIERERVTWHPSGASVPFVLELAELFRPL